MTYEKVKGLTVHSTSFEKPSFDVFFFFFFFFFLFCFFLFFCWFGVLLGVLFKLLKKGSDWL